MLELPWLRPRVRKDVRASGGRPERKEMGRARETVGRLAAVIGEGFETMRNTDSRNRTAKVVGSALVGPGHRITSEHPIDHQDAESLIRT